MDSVKRLEEACREVQKDLRSLESRETSLRVSVDALEQKRGNLSVEVSALEIKKAEKAAEVNSMAQEKERAIHEREARLDARDSELNLLIGRNTAKLMEYEKGLQESRDAQKRYEILEAQYQEKIAGLEEKKAALSELLSK